MKELADGLSAVSCYDTDFVMVYQLYLAMIQIFVTVYLLYLTMIQIFMTDYLLYRAMILASAASDNP